MVRGGERKERREGEKLRRADGSIFCFLLLFVHLLFCPCSSPKVGQEWIFRQS